MLPVLLGDKEIELLYDSGSSAFGLITSKQRYDDNTDPEVKEIRYDANRFGDKMPVFHKNTDHTFLMSNVNLNLTRISYVGQYAEFQKYLSPFTRIGGWLGNLPFTESVLILDMKKEEFVVVSNAGGN